MQGIGKIGGLLAILKLLSIVFKLLHEKQFERRLRGDTNKNATVINGSLIEEEKPAFKEVFSFQTF